MLPEKNFNKINLSSAAIILDDVKEYKRIIHLIGAILPKLCNGTINLSVQIHTYNNSFKNFIIN
jgi:hypothetical protein